MGPESDTLGLEQTKTMLIADNIAVARTTSLTHSLNLQTDQVNISFWVQGEKIDWFLVTLSLFVTKIIVTQRPL